MTANARAPAADLIAQEAQRPHPLRTNRTFGDDPTLPPVAARDRPRLLDHELARGHAHDQRRVIKVTPRPLAAPGAKGLVHATVHPHELPAGAERQPVKVDSSSR